MHGKDISCFQWEDLFYPVKHSNLLEDVSVVICQVLVKFDYFCLQAFRVLQQKK